ncbi:Rieske 2Fe-2S domain-containing protein [Luteibacter sp. 22Crub2.1]|uniref:Rieske (2Fe-2S) protein n=1 Tax=Luteibacter sp. 22Crub2.1 TaxID=1283288 RepID=UPI0009A7FA79|nr:Rieske 2Fe-2S domain-containing protein [Luteibacter sp. 22Crub2.1]SKB30387.1 Ferredoxin subunit of nitrite reductase or a ring-hydroxylating dioxygenase [Luteibacter sp. 22Crub2.1]
MTPTADTAPLCLLADIPDGNAVETEAVIQGEVESLLIYRSGEEARAYLNVCPHAGRRLDYAPGKFLVRNGTIICAAHGATFTAESGDCTNGPCREDRLRAVPVSVVDGEVRLA